MSPTLTWATAVRILRQLAHDPRTIVMMLLAPPLLLFLMRYVFDDERFFDEIAPKLIAIFPFLVMFLVTSIATLRERRSGTLERLMTLPIGKLDLLVGYAVAFTLCAVVQVSLVLPVAFALGLDIAGSVPALAGIALMDAVLGVAFGLFLSAFAHTEFQAVQFLPAFVLPQILLCGLFTPRDSMNVVLEWISNVLPLSYAVSAIDGATQSTEFTSDVWGDLAVVAGFIAAALVLGAVTLRRRTR
ncbi:ABC transporter permease [Spiractinospora alimapuensis]|uniref:ABC transporter permease n=1 Tax=Spiractinospora alimapuensis TaxID=2820884 RepID=UPI001F280B77|nr:ABC transporter permease [Spiractinospora alimapuensis]QVQ50972.1 ABC transporter permease [Spiractinospora alimapuensis]